MQDLGMFSIQPVPVLFNGEMHWLAYLINESGDRLNQLLLDPDHRIVVGRSVADLEEAARNLGVPTNGESESVLIYGYEVTSSVSLDGLIPMPHLIDPETANKLWDGWSMLDDLCLTIGQPLGFRGQIAKTLLDKLFWGMNIGAVTPAGEEFTPVMTEKERAKWDQIIKVARQRVASALALL